MTPTQSPSVFPLRLLPCRPWLAQCASLIAPYDWEHLIRDDEDFRRHVEYCYINPVKHGLVSRVRDWPHSSFHRDVRAGLLPEDWAGDVSAAGSFGERV